MFKLLLLIALGLAGYFVVKSVVGRSNAGFEPDDLYGSADIHRSAD